MDLHQLRVFAAVYRHRSFTKAAGEVRISQPTVSEHVKTLERELGCTLFDRLGRLVAPTREAEILFARASQLLEDVARLAGELRGERELAGEIVLGASTIPGTYTLPELVKEFRDRHPKVSFRVIVEDSARITAMVLRHELLCGIVGARITHAALGYEELFQDRLVLVAAPAVSRKRRITGAELSRLPFVLREQGSGTRQAMEAGLARQGINLSRAQVVAEFSATAAIKEAVKQGLGATIISHLAVQEELAQGRLRELRWQQEEMRRSFYLLQHKKRTLPAAYLEFCRFIKGRQRAG